MVSNLLCCCLACLVCGFCLHSGQSAPRKRVLHSLHDRKQDSERRRRVVFGCGSITGFMLPGLIPSSSSSSSLPAHEQVGHDRKPGTQVLPHVHTCRSSSVAILQDFVFFTNKNQKQKNIFFFSSPHNNNARNKKRKMFFSFFFDWLWRKFFHTA